MGAGCEQWWGPYSKGEDANAVWAPPTAPVCMPHCAQGVCDTNCMCEDGRRGEQEKGGGVLATQPGRTYICRCTLLATSNSDPGNAVTFMELHDFG